MSAQQNQESTCPVQNFLSELKSNKKNFFIEQIPTTCLSQNAYYIESDGEAVVIDPMKDFDQISNLLETRKAKLKYIFETHFHADFVSGHLHLNKTTGAPIIFGPGAKPNYPIINAQENQIFSIGKIKLKIIHTPGHTFESICILLIDENNTQKALFTGDTIFLNEVGRPDLAVKESHSEKDLAGMLFDSIQKIKKLNDEVIIFPGHGAGSACGKNIMAGIGDLLKNQKRSNYAFDENLTKKDFVEMATSNLAKPPSYFFHDVSLNKQGYENIEKLMQKSVKALNYQEFMKLSKDKDTFIIDTRIADDFLKGFYKGSYGISLKIAYATWVATLFKPENKILLITEPGKEKESITRLFRVGYFNILGYLEGGFDSMGKLHENKEEILSFEKKDYNESHEMFNQNSIDLVDVREINEFETTGVVEKSHLYPLSEMERKVEEFKKFKNPIGILCRSGARAIIGTSILGKHGFKNVFVCGGFEGFKNKGFKCVKYLKK